MKWAVGDRCVLADTACRNVGEESVIEMHPRWGRVARFNGGKHVVCVTDDPAVSTFELIRRPT